MTNYLPLVSVIIPTYNRAQYIREAIDSVLAQTYKNLEVIVVDDGSNDDTASLLESYRDRIRYFYQENKGPSTARNLGIRNASGKYVAFLDSDDLWLAGKLQTQIDYLEANPEFGMVHSNMFWEETSTLAPDATRKTCHFEPYPSGYILRELFDGNPIIPSSVVMRTECLELVGPFDEELRNSEDTHLWLRIAKNYSIGYLFEPLGIHRRHETNISGNWERDTISAINAREKFLRLNPEIVNELGDEIMRIGLTERVHFLAHTLFKRGDYKRARKYYYRSIKLQPYHWPSYGCYLASWLPASLVTKIRKLRKSVLGWRNSSGPDGFTPAR